jgi:hypothetical protein
MRQCASSAARFTNSVNILSASSHGNGSPGAILAAMNALPFSTPHLYPARSLGAGEGTAKA